MWAGSVQEMVLPEGQAKGLRTTLVEQGTTTATKKVDDIRTVLSDHDDFRTEKAAVHNKTMLKAKDTKPFSSQNSIVN